MRNIFLALLLMVTPLVVVAQDEVKSATDGPLTYAEYAAKKKAIIEDLDDGVRYMEILPSNKKRVLDALERIGALLGDVPSELSLTADAAKQLRDDEVVVNELLSRAESDSRLLCKTSAATGSNMLRRRCQTYAKKLARMNNDQDAMRGFSHRLSPTPRANDG